MSDDTSKNAQTGTETDEEPGKGSGSGSGTTPQSTSRSIDGFPDEAQDYIRRLRQENAGARNELKEIKQELQKLKDEGKTEQQRREDALKDAEKRASETGAKLLRFEVAADKGLPSKMAGRLQGSTKEELEADAEDLKKELGLDSNGGSTSSKGGFDGGPRRSVTPKPKSMNGLIRQAAGL